MIKKSKHPVAWLHDSELLSLHHESCYHAVVLFQKSLADPGMGGPRGCGRPMPGSASACVTSFKMLQA